VFDLGVDEATIEIVRSVLCSAINHRGGDAFPNLLDLAVIAQIAVEPPVGRAR